MSQETRVVLLVIALVVGIAIVGIVPVLRVSRAPEPTAETTSPSEAAPSPPQPPVAGSPAPEPAPAQPVVIDSPAPEPSPGATATPVAGPAAPAPIPPSTPSPVAQPQQRPRRAVPHLYIVQAAVVQDRATALRLAERLRKAGFRPYFVTTKSGVALRIGAFSKKEHAERLRARAAQKGFPAYVIVRSQR